MPDVILTGPEGRLEGRYHPGPQDGAPIALVLHAHPKGGGHMQEPVTVALFDLFKERGFAVLRFNFRGVGRSQASLEHGMGELSDAATALDWLQSLPQNANATQCWIGGFSFGAYIGMQLLMRRPEVRGFISVAPPMNMYDFSFLAPCPASGLVVNGTADQVVPADEVARVVPRIRTQKGIVVEHQIIDGANHFFHGYVEPMTAIVAAYLDKRLAKPDPPPPSGRK